MEQTERIEHVFFDFDSTLSVAAWVPHLQRNIISDDDELCLQLTDDEILANYGGRKRLRALHALLGRLQALNVSLFVLSHGRQKGLAHMLSKGGLSGFFQRCFASDGPELQAVAGVKGKLIEQYVDQVVKQPWIFSAPRNTMEQEYVNSMVLATANKKVLFIDDTKGHLDSASCCTHQVVDRSQGLSEAEMQAVLNLCGDATDTSSQVCGLGLKAIRSSDITKYTAGQAYKHGGVVHAIDHTSSIVIVRGSAAEVAGTVVTEHATSKPTAYSVGNPTTTSKGLVITPIAIDSERNLVFFSKST